MSKLPRLLEVITSHDGINDKSQLSALIAKEFELTADRSVYYCEDFAIRFSSATGASFSNTVLSFANQSAASEWELL